MKNQLILPFTILLLLSMSISAQQFINDQELWQHVVTIDRMVWQEQAGEKKINNNVNEEDFVRRVYLDLTGKIPTYEQLNHYLKSKNINKRQEIISTLLGFSRICFKLYNFLARLIKDRY